ncbi:MAG: hypothetical protein JRM80_01525 [Nitrososphaerota archaeon]|nr:hypothetical protein [Nitrososphaerota archaeon]
MRRAWKVGLLVGLALIVAGLYLAVFGAVYYTIYEVQGHFETCAPGCTSSGYQSVPVTYSMYPIWSPPSWTHVDYNATCSITSASYTPLDPPPSCLPLPAGNLPVYSRNYSGIALVVIGAILTAAAVKSGMGRPRMADRKEAQNG